MVLAGVIGVVLDNLAPTIEQDITSKRQYLNKIFHNIWFWCLHTVEWPCVERGANALLNQLAIAAHKCGIHPARLFWKTSSQFFCCYTIGCLNHGDLIIINWEKSSKYFKGLQFTFNMKTRRHPSDKYFWNICCHLTFSTSIWYCGADALESSNETMRTCNISRDADGS